LIRLQKILSAAGVASRRASEQMILDGRVMVNGETIRALGSKADPSKDVIKVDGRRIKTDVAHRYIVLYKPKGYVTTRSDPEGRKTVMDLIGEGAYIYPVGRLDYDSEGLLLMMTDGDLAARLMHPRHEVDKVYEVIVMGSPDPRGLEKLRKGVYIDGGRTSPAEMDLMQEQNARARLRARYHGIFACFLAFAVFKTLARLAARSRAAGFFMKASTFLKPNVVA